MPLTDEQVAEIRALYASGEATQCELEDRFGASQQYISRIVHNIARRSRYCAICGTQLPRYKHKCCGAEACVNALRDRKKLAYRERHPGEESARARRWQQAHPEQYAEAHRRAARNYERRQAAKRREERSA